VFQVRRKPNGHEVWFLGDGEIAIIGPSVIECDISERLCVSTVPTHADMSFAWSLAS
jgi:hypothetical protein